MPTQTAQGGTEYRRWCVACEGQLSWLLASNVAATSPSSIPLTVRTVGYDQEQHAAKGCRDKVSVRMQVKPLIHA